jgi:histidinol-phosphate aminotransferase
MLQSHWSLSFKAFPVESAVVGGVRAFIRECQPAFVGSFQSETMIDTISKIKPSVRQLQAYTLKHFEAPVKINQNENPYDMPEVIKAEVQREIAQRSWSRYPAFVPSVLISKLARFSGWKNDGILVGNGSNELIEAALMVTVAKGTSVVISQPTFTLYKLMATILGGELKEVLLTEPLEFDIPALLEAASRADVTIICSPNNPTGCLMRLSDLKTILRTAAGLVIVDEAYHEFSRQTVVPLLEEFENLIVLRTFSKAMAMAGLRVGYLLAHPKLVQEISKAKLPYNLNIFSMAAAEAALEHFDLLKPQINLLIEERERLYGLMSRIPGVKAYPSQANFIAFETAMAPADVFNSLYADGILVRDVSRYPMLGKFLRVSVGSPLENDQFLAALKKTLEVAAR